MSLLSFYFLNCYLNLANLASLLLAGEEGAPAGEGEPGGQMPSPCGQGGGSILLPLLLCFVVFYFLLIMPERKKQKARQAMIHAVKKGDQVVTTSGIIGKVMKVEEREVVVQVDRDNDVRIKFLKSAVHEVIPEGGYGQGPGPGTDINKGPAPIKP